VPARSSTVEGVSAPVVDHLIQFPDRNRTGSGPTDRAVLLAAAIVGMLYLFDSYPLTTVSDSGGLVDVLFVPLVVTLTIGVGGLGWLLSTRLLVYGGQISFGLYMVHELVHTAWDWAVVQFEFTLRPDYPGKLVVVGLLAVAVGAAILLFHFVEEPARRWMRGMVHVRRSTTNPRTYPPADPVTTPRQPSDDAPKVRTHGVPVRAV
jgi:peptidoglycan/LPS O-acetylase OafA/YrhL